MNKDALHKNTLFPVFLKPENIRFLIVGGGNVALEKLQAIFSNSPAATVKLVAGKIAPATLQFLRSRQIPYAEKSFSEQDLQDVNLVIVAVNDKNASRQIKICCRHHNILTNVADTPDLCDFYLSSVVQKGDLKIAISTNGKSPTIAKRVKEVLTKAFPDEIDDVLANLAAIREQLSGDFQQKVQQLNKITEVLVASKNSEVNRSSSDF
ncbi:bifunctional precorrin-2 dehydrogenase/sirohydrochlorin ferrochelatase [Pedobacter sp. BS3]|uniref:precorrin-2 dehydrogenase/sirohydrochlorin ferrochelatase family protein n=1 Tax=Pedobacter sp. BS3 TaxID=2567937 RepID=UPI0011EC53BE|nr:bifunctional precorrin-2 dehydrogenase/sirohydrochlorin ferrochelatase [Pedobacter sp. BS3]TZF83047.1 bifunctional precorrin-2 dehydrogenase/sirohydrochlorin ferrochelatase [Pedobacter sp. BS3]